MTKNKYPIAFIGLSLILIIVLGLALLYIPKGELHLLLCDRHTPARDIFYRYYTHIAEWLPYVVCVLILLFGRIGDGVYASTSMIVSSLVAQGIKHLVRAPRPLSWFAENVPDVTLPLSPGVDMNYWLSFPSGHTTSFFAMAFVLSLIATQKRSISIAVQILLFALAALGGYSRIYLSQHFTLDVLAGIVIGVGISCICWAVFQRFEGQKWYNYHLFAKKTP